MFRAQNQNNVHGCDINSGNCDDSDFCVTLSISNDHAEEPEWTMEYGDLDS